MSFDVQQFLEQTVTDSNSTQREPVPVGEYNAIIKKVDARSWTSKNDPSKSGVTLDVTWSLDDATVRETLGRDEVTARQGIMLDFTDSGHLDMGKGKNVGLGRLRDAVSLNNPGQAFSFTQLIGRVAKVSIKHRVDGENIYDEVDRVARLA